MPFQGLGDFIILRRNGMNEPRLDLLGPFKEAIKNKPFLLRECSLCNHPLHYFAKDGDIYFNSSCFCVTYFSPDQLSDDNDLMFYLYPNHGHISRIENFIKEVQEGHHG